MYFCSLKDQPKTCTIKTFRNWLSTMNLDTISNIHYPYLGFRFGGRKRIRLLSWNCISTQYMYYNWTNFKVKRQRNFGMFIYECECEMRNVNFTRPSFSELKYWFYFPWYTHCIFFIIAFEFPTSPFKCSVCMRFAHILHWFNAL